MTIQTRKSSPGKGYHRTDREAIGESEAFLDFQQALSRVAPVNRPVLLIGERGTGKELAASRIHFLSTRWDGPFVALNCSALSPTVIESELFGHEAGAFTGAAGLRKGRFEAADGGTLFLDEIAQTPLPVQEKILRVVEYQTFERVGSSTPIHVDVRIIAATNADLAVMAEAGQFKQDLLDRLAFEVLYLPPLRERGDDVFLLATRFAAAMAQELGYEGVPEIGPEVLRELGEHAWPGNVRELKNAVERSVCRAGSARLDRLEINPFRREPSGPGVEAVPSGQSGRENRSFEVPRARGGPGPGFRFADAIRSYERDLLRQALEDARYNQKRAARRLGMTYDQFRGLYRKHRDTLESGG